MARQTGLLKIKGTLDNVTFYKSKDGDIAKMKTSVDAARIANVEKTVKLTTHFQSKLTTYFGAN